VGRRLGGKWGWSEIEGERRRFRGWEDDGKPDVGRKRGRLRYYSGPQGLQSCTKVFYDVYMSLFTMFIERRGGATPSVIKKE
jgi:hypothetical protein